MASIIMTLPVLPGKVEQARQFGQAKAGPRLRELDAANRRHGLTKELWQLQEGPEGPTLLVYGEAPDLAEFFRAYAAADGPFERWEKQQIQENTGLDMDAPMTGPWPETLFEWHA